MPINCVVAAYEEDLSWIDECPPDWAVHVYLKGEPKRRPAREVRESRLFNLGREAHAFAFHNANSPQADYTVFLQGNPFDHDPHAIENAAAVIQRQDWVGWLGFRYDTRQNSPPFTPNDLSLWGVYESLFRSARRPDWLWFPAGAQLVVRREAISHRSRRFWQRLERMTFIDDWRMAHAIERLWPTIYDQHTPENTP